MPDDSFYMLGFNGQYTVIVPSRRLVIVRLGDDHAPEQGIRAFAGFVGDVVRAVDQEAALSRQ
jgi:hypothetical protein